MDGGQGVRADGGAAVGAAIGIAAAIILCWLLYRRAVHLNVGVFFNRTAVALIVIAAGVLAYGLGDLQDAGWLPGHTWVAFDLTAHIDPGSWWASIITWFTELSPKMTVLQVTAWLAYLVVVIPAFISAGPARQNPRRSPRKSLPGKPAEPAPRAGDSRGPRPVGAPRRTAPVGGGRGPGCGPGPRRRGDDRRAARGGHHRGNGHDRDESRLRARVDHGDHGHPDVHGRQQLRLAGEISLDNSAGAVVGEIETLGPGTSAPLTATRGAGTYSFSCLMGSLWPRRRRSRSPCPRDRREGGLLGRRSRSKPVTVAELTPPKKRYQAYAAVQLTSLAEVRHRHRDHLKHGSIARAKQDWLTAQLAWERVGASYDSFGDLGLCADEPMIGRADPSGVNDKGFTGLHRLEYGLWHGQSAAELVPVVRDPAGEERRDRAEEPDLRRPDRRPHQAVAPRARDHRGRAARPPVRHRRPGQGPHTQKHVTPRSPGRSSATWRR